jgi:hypothetical protein
MPSMEKTMNLGASATGREENTGTRASWPRYTGGRRGVWMGPLACTLFLGLMGLLGAPVNVSGQAPPSGARPKAPPRLPHPAIPLLDERGINVLKSKGPISTRKTCGDCHDYDFIADSFHFQQGRNEMDPKLMAAHGIAPFNSSPGMYGKFSIIPNRQLTHLGVTGAEDFDMGTPEWLMKCGACHTGAGISEFDSENRLYGTLESSQVKPFDRDYHTRDPKTGEVVVWDWKKSGTAEADCFLCHVPKASRGARKEAMAKGDFRWANNATLSESGIVRKDERGGYTYEPGAFAADGTVKPDVLALSDPNLENCAQCHGFTAKNTTNIQPIQHADIMRGTEKAGWIYNGAKISDTASPIIVGREKMNYPWDVHAAKDLVCIDCHFSPNNPGRMIQTDAKKNLRYRPGQNDIAVYLKRPDHNFARGNIPPETVNMTRHNTMRGCADCHDAEKEHAFLPYKSLHFKALACQTCHIPAVHFWAYRSDSWGFLMDTGTSRITLRGIDGDISDPDSQVTGFLPAYIPTPDRDGNLQIRPTNLITGVYWFDKGKGRPVFTWQVQKALFSGKDDDGAWVYRPEIVKAFGDADGIIDRPQAVFDTPGKIELVRGLLQKHAGISDPDLRVEVVPWAMGHSVVGKGQAVKVCTACHSGESMLHRPVDLDDVLPGGVPVYYSGAQRAVVRHTKAGAVFDNRELLAKFYIIGNTRVAWIEWAGWVAILGTLLLVLVHGLLRIVGGK